MITPWMIYAIGILDSVGNLLLVLGAVASGLLILFALFWVIVVEDYPHHTGTAKNAMRFLLPCALICLTLSAFLPSTRLAAAMYIVPAVASNEDLRAIGGNSLEALRKLTEQWLRELGEEKRNSPTQGRSL